MRDNQQAGTPSEQFVYSVCQKTFLSLWSYANPVGLNRGKELCDVLVVCDPHILVLSVKDIHLSNTGDLTVDWNRWRRKAIDESISQIKGAVRALHSIERVTRKDGRPGLLLPPVERRIYHRIAVACGGQSKVAIQTHVNIEDKVYHVFDETSFSIVLKHLDTITDFVDYLTAKEGLLSQASIFISGGEENLLAAYLCGDRRFPGGPDMFLLDGDLWAHLSRRRKFKAKLKADHVSYKWDLLIEVLCEGDFAPENLPTHGLPQPELALRIMSKENRFARRVLGAAFQEFMELGCQGKVRARMVQSPSGVGYVFFIYDSDSTPEARLRELTGRCLASLCHFDDCSSVVGIDVNRPKETPLGGFTHDLVVLQRYQDTWPEEYLKEGCHCRNELGYFKQPALKQSSVDEYPPTRK